MTSPSGPRRLGVDSPAALLAIIPHLLGFVPDHSLVLIGAGAPSGRIDLAVRFDLPDPPDAGATAAIAAHATTLLDPPEVTTAVIIGYGPGPLVTPLADALRQALADTKVTLRDVLRVEGNRYWSYLCGEPSCCPPDGVPFDAARHPAAAVMTVPGHHVLASRAALAATIAPVTGLAAEAMQRETRRAERIAAKLVAGMAGPDAPPGGPRPIAARGLTAVQAAITAYRQGGTINHSSQFAWLALVLTSLRVRDDAWARMDPARHHAHQRLWTDLTRHAQPGYIPAAASLLAFTAWQGGNGALANLALDRALDDDPRYSMALLLRDVIGAGAPPSLARLPMTPEEVAVSYGDLPGEAPPGNAPPGEGDDLGQAAGDGPDGTTA